eukprot:TRINITY_DN4801_c0_g2_i11.p1 TRINITY_DN4801_c0_g2~~TRINITY_DN4801_c0_g2_i11.p1  ORF type:complete len:167 (+),score=29.56 TRINITY_DN4801_c0_g2_i11:65-565(+)
MFTPRPCMANIKLMKHPYLFLTFLYLASAAVLELSTSEYRSLVSSGKTLLVKFDIDWCDHCVTVRELFSTLEENLKALNIDCTIGSVSAEDNLELVNEYGVRNYPDVRLIANGRVHRFTWAFDRKNLVEFVKRGVDTNPIKGLSELSAVRNEDAVFMRSYPPLKVL